MCVSDDVIFLFFVLHRMIQRDMMQKGSAVIYEAGNKKPFLNAAHIPDGSDDNCANDEQTAFGCVRVGVTLGTCSV